MNNFPKALNVFVVLEDVELPEKKVGDYFVKDDGANRKESSVFLRAAIVRSIGPDAAVQGLEEGNYVWYNPFDIHKLKHTDTVFVEGKVIHGLLSEEDIKLINS